MTSFITPKAQAAPPCFIFTITGSRLPADVELNGINIQGATAVFKDGDVVYGTWGGCPPGTVAIAMLTTYRWDIQSSTYLIIGQSTIQLGSACESGSWTLHVQFQSQQPPCGTAGAYYTANQLYCPCGS